MAAPKAPLLDAAGKRSKDVSLDGDVFGAEVKQHLVHEVVRAEAAAQRAGTRAVKSRGIVAGGRSKPWRQKGTGRARAGSVRAPQWTGGAAAFQTRTSFELKVNRKVRRSALRGVLSRHVANGTLAVADAEAFGEPSTRAAAAFLAAWNRERPVLVVARDGEEAVAKSFRNLERVAVVTPAEVDVSALAWARSVVVSQAALEELQRRAA